MASGNAGKLREIKRILGDQQVTVVPQSELGATDLARRVSELSPSASITERRDAALDSICTEVPHPLSLLFHLRVEDTRQCRVMRKKAEIQMRRDQRKEAKEQRRAEVPTTYIHTCTQT